MNRFVLLLLLTVFLGADGPFQEPTPAEMGNQQNPSGFESFLQLWQEERYFEMYDYGKKQSREILSLEEFATRMVELDWVPVGLSPKPSEISYRYRTLLYMNANIVFRHKSFYDLQFTKPKAFLLQKRKAWNSIWFRWSVPYYSPENSWTVLLF